MVLLFVNNIKEKDCSEKGKDISYALCSFKSRAQNVSFLHHG